MKEFIEKLIGRLEEKFKYNSEQAEIYRDGSDTDAYFREKKDLYMDRANTYGEVIRIVNQLSEETSISKTESVGWIPCSERLPEDGETVLVQDFEEHYEILNCETKYGVKGFSNGWWASANNYIAWQPLPQAYQPKGE